MIFDVRLDICGYISAARFQGQGLDSDMNGGGFVVLVSLQQEAGDRGQSTKRYEIGYGDSDMVGFLRRLVESK